MIKTLFSLCFCCLVTTLLAQVATQQTTSPVAVESSANGIDSIYIPNIFSPDDDGVNDLFRPFGKAVEFLSIAIFDRWGSLVFKSFEPDATWDGKQRGFQVPQGMYIYAIRYRDLKTGEDKSKVGDLMLVRD